jgi:hypothetical protein
VTADGGTHVESDAQSDVTSELEAKSERHSQDPVKSLEKDVATLTKDEAKLTKDEAKLTKDEGKLNKDAGKIETDDIATKSSSGSINALKLKRNFHNFTTSRNSESEIFIILPHPVIANPKFS